MLKGVEGGRQRPSEDAGPRRSRGKLVAGFPAVLCSKWRFLKGAKWPLLLLGSQHLSCLNTCLCTDADNREAVLPTARGICTRARPHHVDSGAVVGEMAGKLASKMKTLKRAVLCCCKVYFRIKLSQGKLN